jgi:hypothetical protein
LSNSSTVKPNSATLGSIFRSMSTNLIDVVFKGKIPWDVQPSVFVTNLFLFGPRLPSGVLISETEGRESRELVPFRSAAVWHWGNNCCQECTRWHQRRWIRTECIQSNSIKGLANNLKYLKFKSQDSEEIFLTDNMCKEVRLNTN